MVGFGVLITSFAHNQFWDLAETCQAHRFSYDENMTQPNARIEVPKVLSAKQVEFFVENGYLTAESLVTMDEVDEIRADAVKLARGGYPCESLRPLPATMSDQEVLQNILC